MWQKETPKMTQEPENQASPKSDKERRVLKEKKPVKAKESKSEDSGVHPMVDYQIYKRRGNPA